MVEEKEPTKWEDDQDDETIGAKRIVQAPNGKSYEVKGLSSWERQRIIDETTAIELGGRSRAADFQMVVSKQNALILQRGVSKPDFSKHSIDEIMKWMAKKLDGTVSFLLDQIAVLSGTVLKAEDETFGIRPLD